MDDLVSLNFDVLEQRESFLEELAPVQRIHLAVVVKSNNIPFWGRCTTHFRTYFSGDWDVHWWYGILTHGHLTWFLFGHRFQKVKPLFPGP